MIMRYTITAESDGERILKIGQHLPKLWARIEWVFFRLDALALSVVATATWLAGWLAGWLGGCHTPVLYQNG